MGNLFCPPPAHLTGPAPSKADAPDDLDRLIDALLLDPDSNLALVPDAMERKVYRRILIKVLTDLKVVLSQTKVHVLGQEITFSMQPVVMRP